MKKQRQVSSKSKTLVIEETSLLLEDNGTIPQDSIAMLLIHIKLDFLALSPFFAGVPGSLPSDRWPKGSFSSAEQGDFLPTWSRGE